MPNLPIDLDLEAVQFDGSWYTREELAKKIKSSLESGDYAISRPSQALEYLTAQLGSAKNLSFKVTQELAEALNQAASRQNRSAASLLRDALAAALAGGGQAPGAPSGSRDPIGRRDTQPEMPAVGAPVAATPPPLPLPPAPPGLNPAGAAAAPIPGPGAIRSAQYTPPGAEPKVIIEQASVEEAATAVDLKPKKKDALDDAEVERRWFGG